MTTPVGTHRLLISRGLRAFADGYVALLLPAYLLQFGYGPLQIGLIATATLLGSGLLTLLVGTWAHRFHYRSLLLGAAALMAATGLGFACFTGFWPLLLIALVGTLNPSSGDVSVFLPLEHAVLARIAGDRERTAVFARYSLTGSMMGAFGSLAASLPALAGSLHVQPVAVMQAMFILYALIGVAAGLLYRGLPKELGGEAGDRRAAPLTVSKARVYTLAALFSLDSLGGGLVVQSMLALWLYQRFGMSTSSAAAVFFWTGVFSALSYLVAVRIASRLGLVRTMVFTHLPANLCLMLIPFMPSLVWVIVLLFVRSALSQMDVPTRSSYVMAIVTPGERPAAASITAVPRSLASAVSPYLAGYLLSMSSFGWPLLAAGALKTLYDLLLLALFGKVRPPEEERRAAPS